MAVRGDWIARRLWANQRGSLLFFALGINAIILLIFVNMFPFFQTVVRAPSFAHQHDQARQLAEAGVSETLRLYNLGAMTVNIADLEAAGWVCPGGTCTKTATPVLASGGAVIGEYTGVINFASTPNARITITASIPSATAPQVQEQLRVHLRHPSPSIGFKYGVFAGWFGEVYYQVDSYDSTLGGYNADLGGGEFNVGAEASIGGNGNDPDGMSDLAVRIPNPLMGTAYKATGTTHHGDPATATGGLVEQDAEPLPPIVIPPEATSAFPNPSLTLTGTTTQTASCNGNGVARYASIVIRDSAKLIIPPGCTLYVHGKNLAHNLHISMNGSLEAQGNNRIFLEGAFYAGGPKGIENVSQNPHDLLIFAKNLDTLGDDLRSDINQLAFYGAVYVEHGALIGVPNSTAPWSHYYGAFMGGPDARVGIWWTGGAFRRIAIHQDLSLTNIAVSGQTGQVSEDYTIRAWEPLTPSNLPY